MFKLFRSRRFCAWFYWTPAFPILLCCTVSCTQKENYYTHRTAVDHLYAYQFGEFRAHVEPLIGHKLPGYDNDTARRNAAGTALYVFSYSEAKSRYETIVISIGKVVRVLDQPARAVALDDSLHFVAWSKNSFEDGVSFRNGYHQKGGIPEPRFDPGGLYYSVVTEQPKQKPSTSIISSTDRPDAPLAKVNFDVIKMFVKGSRLYVFGSGLPVPGSGFDPVFDKAECSIFRIDQGQLVFEESIDIPRPSPGPLAYYVQDMDPWSANVLLIDIRGDIVPSKWVLFNLDSRTITSIGRSKGFGFFMQYDVLEESPAIRH